MKRMMTLSLLALAACASGAAAPRAVTTTTTTNAAATSCGSLAPQLLARNSDVFARPDSTSQVVVHVRSDTPVCAAVEKVGFGYRLVRFGDGRVGYVNEDDLVSQAHSG